MNAVVICNGSIQNFEYIKGFIEKESFIICCDGGLKYCGLLGIKPDIIAGDFDSAEDCLLSSYKKAGVEILKVPAKKDFTDGELGVNIAIERGFKSIVLLGATGKRLDHTLGNIHLLAFAAEKGAFAKIVDEHNVVMLCSSRLCLELPKGTTVSLIPFTGDACGVCIRGAYYPLNKALLKVGATLGISNVTVEDNIEISVEKGILAVIIARD